MKTYLNIETGLLTQAVASTQGIRSLSAKRGDLLELEVIPSAPITGAAGIFAAKQKGTYSGDPVALDSAWSAPATEGAGYLFSLSLNTTELNALFSGETPEVTLMAEITWSLSGAVRSTQTFDLVVARDVWTGDEGAPSDAEGTVRISLAGLEIKDSVTGVWRSVTFANGELTFTTL